MQIAPENIDILHDELPLPCRLTPGNLVRAKDLVSFVIYCSKNGNHPQRKSILERALSKTSAAAAIFSSSL